jgi:hypothetical protein
MQAHLIREGRAFSTRETPNLTASQALKRLPPKDPHILTDACALGGIGKAADHLGETRGAVLTMRSHTVAVC